ncbi:LysR substrate-binding domain-containing protein [Streptomyces sp. NK08204]|uniref:LysR substrate-binding domain-containing protein n=1 Tax=Streptomyces sp. NK08204 TaxID=2873260 RepID=UPI001CEC61FB|nr:LysR substrate-binding domain-containing protein [Streptomyces sp. NK08204]
MPDPTPRPVDSPIRFGYPSSPRTALDILASAGLSEDRAVLAPYDLADPFSALRRGELDVSVVKFGPQEPDLVTSKVLHFEPRAVVVSARHPLAGRDTVSVEEIAAYDAFERPGDFPEYLWDDIVPRRTPQGRPIHRRHRVNGIPEMMALVVQSDAVHLSVASLADMAPPAIRVVPVHDLPPAPVCLAWYRHAELPGHVARFIAAAEAASPVAASR